MQSSQYTEYQSDSTEKPEFSSQSDSITTAWDYLVSQEQLEKEAKLLMPYDPKKCSYEMGEIRQQLYACLTCYKSKNEIENDQLSEANKQKIEYNAICYSCSIQCHSGHELVELFTKRDFQCDCGTTRFPNGSECNLRKSNNDIPSSSNIYNHNFQGLFCHCDSIYDPQVETGNMIQCRLGDVCNEDWYHDYCLVTEAKPTKDYKDQLKDFPSLNDFDGFICWKCINNNKDFFELIKSDNKIVHRVMERKKINRVKDSVKQEGQGSGKKGDDGDDEGDHQFKKRKLQQDFSIFLNPNYQENFKASIAARPSSTIISNFFKNFPFLLTDDPIYEPENDDDNESIVDLGTRAINTLPREQAVQGVEAFNDIKDKLKLFLTPFAENDKVVNKEDIETFFKKLKEKRT
ncbi:hypothetical protein WICMUC_002170 [Wickerhamomyces mucosus]|uniref:UBR-type domain-containing protein n=1 Tax=Wickerhamomyces mucosus TaxID=1378264 RepID=A0A9P8PPY9_9ASCO|nr:hypothetical protein WICMUC_002170 [Wickerhamomyces mucosus]